MNEVFQVAIDGPSGAGKSTIAKKVAVSLGLDYIDTGAMYRAVAWKMLNEGIGLSDRTLLSEMLERTDIDFVKGDILLDGEIVNDRIRTPEVSKMASDSSAFPEVREKLVALQRNMGQSKCVIMDGRDIGTNVFPAARYKFFLTASVAERAKRRWLELTQKGEQITLEKVEEDIAARDHNDSTRELNPLKKAEDAVEVDTTAMNIEEVTTLILNQIQK
ncbi:MAG: (d)CMP kinase [Eubacteriales bacterium]|nr:(d)CMP kinase [Eubacteriales bacterium]